MRFGVRGLVGRASTVLLLWMLSVVAPIGSLGLGETRAEGTPGEVETRNVEVVGQTGGAVYAVAVRDGYAYVGQDRRLVVMDISDPTQPRVVGAGPPRGSRVQSVQLVGEYAFVLTDVDTSTQSGGWQVLRITDPANPVEVGQTWKLGGFVSAGSPPGSSVYATVTGGDRNDHRLIDLSDPTSPKEVPGSDIVSGDLMVGNGYVFAFGSDGLTIYDVSEPSAPRPTGTLALKSFVSVHALAGTYLYLLREKYLLDIIDVADPVNPRLVSETDYSRSMLDNITVAGSRAYLTSRYYGLLTVVDVSDPARPTTLGTAKTDVGPPQQAAIAGDYAYLAATHGGLRIFAVGDAAHPAEVAAYDGPSNSTPSVAQAGDYAYVADMIDGVQIIRVSDPAHPVKVGHFRDGGEAMRIAASGTDVYVLEHGLGGTDDGFRILDVRDPASPRLVASIDLPDLRANDLVLVGSYAYVATSASVIVFDVADPADPRELGHYTQPLAEPLKGRSIANRTSRIAVDGQMVYMAFMTEEYTAAGHSQRVTDEGSGLAVIDMANPASPVVVSQTNVALDPASIAVVDHHAYVVASSLEHTQSAVLVVYDASNPASPVRTAALSVHRTGGTSNIVVAGHFAYVASSSLVVLDVSDPARPVEVGAHAYMIESVATDGTLAYVGAGSDGLMIVRLTNNPSGTS